MELSDEMISTMCAVSIGRVADITKRILKKGRKRGIFMKQTRYVLSPEGHAELKKRFPSVYIFDR
jgi:hypothetical protein